MNKNYARQAKLEAVERIEQGYSPACLVHIVEYPVEYFLHGVDFQHLSTPLPPDADLSGHTSTYYTLAELAFAQ